MLEFVSKGNRENGVFSVTLKTNDITHDDEYIRETASSYECKNLYSWPMNQETSCYVVEFSNVEKRDLFAETIKK